MPGLDFQHKSVQLVDQVIVLARVQLVRKLDLDIGHFVVDCEDLVQLFLLDGHVGLLGEFLHQVALLCVQVVDLFFDELHEVW